MTVVWFFCSLFWKVFIRHHLQDSRSIWLNDLIWLLQNRHRCPPTCLLPAVLDDPLPLCTGLLVTGSAQLVALKFQRQAHSHRGHLNHTIKTSAGVWKHGLSNARHMDEEMTYIKGPGAVSVGGVVAREEGCLQRPLHPQDCPKLNSGAAHWTNVKTAFKHKWSNSFKSTVTTKHRHGWS